MRILFMGTPDIAAESLAALLDAGHEVCGVFSQPDKPVGRHQNKLRRSSSWLLSTVFRSTSPARYGTARPMSLSKS